MTDSTRNARRPRRGRPGKPAGDDGGDARRRLLQAAAGQFAAAGFAGTSLRAVARDAGVTPAMIAYYFGDKAGLLEAVLVTGLDEVLGALEAALDDGGGDSAPALERFVAAELEALTSHPWIPRIMVQEVLSKDTPLRQVFVDRFASRALALVRPAMAADLAAGRMRADLDPRLVILSVIGMCVFPFLAEPLLGPLVGYRIDDDFAGEFVPHTLALLARGLGAES